jgi:class 3 adenylate cyclase
MTPLRTTVVMKTDISGSTPLFRALLTSDLQALLSEHRSLLARYAAEHDGRIVKPTGDGYWLEFSSVTGAAKAAISIQGALRLEQLNRGDDRLAVRIVIALGDIAVQDGDLVGDTLALAARIETITPPDEIYLTAAATLALTPSEIQTAPVGSFTLKGFTEPVPVYRVQQRHRTRVLAETYMLFSDLCGFGPVADGGPISRVEQTLDAYDALVRSVAQEFSGTIRFNLGDAYCVTFVDAEQAIAGAEHIAKRLDDMRQKVQFPCSISIGLHRGTLYAFRSFLHGRDVHIASRLQSESARLLEPGESGIFISGIVRDALFGTAFHNRFEPVALRRPSHLLGEIEIFRLR